MSEGKICTKCGEFKPFNGFHKSKKWKDGYRSKCKACRKNENEVNNTRNKNRYANDESYRESVKQYHKDLYLINKKQINEANNIRNKNRYANDEEYREKGKKRKKEWRKNNKEHEKSYREARREMQSEYNANWRSENKLRIKLYRQSEKGREVSYQAKLKRKSHKHKVKFTPHERKRILDRDNWTCQNCSIKVHDRIKGNWNTPDKAHVDHIIPLVHGGNSEPNNLQILCRTCNLKKHAKIELQLSLF